MPHFLSDSLIPYFYSEISSWSTLRVLLMICKREEKARLVGLTKLLNDILQSKQDA